MSSVLMLEQQLLRDVALAAAATGADVRIDAGVCSNVDPATMDKFKNLGLYYETFYGLNCCRKVVS